MPQIRLHIMKKLVIMLANKTRYRSLRWFAGAEGEIDHKGSLDGAVTVSDPVIEDGAEAG